MDVVLPSLTERATAEDAEVVGTAVEVVFSASADFEDEECTPVVEGGMAVEVVCTPVEVGMAVDVVAASASRAGVSFDFKKLKPLVMPSFALEKPSAITSPTDLSSFGASSVARRLIECLETLLTVVVVVTVSLESAAGVNLSFKKL